MIIIQLFFTFRIYVKEPKGHKESVFHQKNYDPYEQDLEHFPDCKYLYSNNYEIFLDFILPNLKIYYNRILKTFM